MSNINPNYIATLFFLWMLLYWTFNSLNSYMDVKLTGLKFELDSINQGNKTRFVIYLAVGGMLLVLGVLAWLV